VALSCENHTAYIYDRGGKRQIGKFENLTRVKWERRRDDPSTAQVYTRTPSPECAKMMGMVNTNRHELVIFRGRQRVWEGPIMRVAYTFYTVEIEAHDVMRYVGRTIQRLEYDSRFPNTETVISRVQRILTAEMARKEAQDPPINFLAHVQYIPATAPATDARTAARTLPYEMTVFEGVDSYAARGGLDYTVVGRRTLFFDVHTIIGQTPMVTKSDFIGSPIITQYGMEFASYVAMTDGKGHYGAAGGVDPYYGEWEVLYQAYDENTGPAVGAIPPTVAELTSQAQRALGQSRIPPMVVRVPDNTQLNPNGVLRIEDLVPGVHIPLQCAVPGRTISQMQKLDRMTVEETADDGEVIKVTLSPATAEAFVEDAI
jgi:hypothetical protein